MPPAVSRGEAARDDFAPGHCPVAVTRWRVVQPGAPRGLPLHARYRARRVGVAGYAV